MVTQFTHKVMTALVALFVVASFSVPFTAQGASFSIADQRCENSDGVVELNIPNDASTLTVEDNTNNETIIDGEDMSGTNLKTISMLRDGNFTATITKENNNQETLNFTVDCDQDIDPIAGSCSANPESVDINEETVWNAKASGGDGQYSYSWSGAASGNDKTVNETYSTKGQKTASVTITSGDGQEISRDCNVQVSNPLDELSFNAKRCAPENASDQDGVLEYNAPNSLDSYTLTDSNGNEVVSETAGVANGMVTISRLKDGTFTFSGTLNGETKTLAPQTIDCDEDTTDPDPDPDPEDPDISINAQWCAPENASNQNGVVEINTPNSLDSYKVINRDTGNVVSESAEGVANGMITVNGLADGNYRFEGTLNNTTETLNFSVDCDDDAPDPQPICPYDASDGTVITFNNNDIVSNGSESDARTNPANLNLSAGTYTIKMYGYDDHANSPGQNQQNESFYLSLQNNGSEITKTGNLGDVPDTGSLDERTRTFNNVTLGESIAQVVGIHAAYPNNSSANSVSVGCAAFKKIDDGGSDLGGSCSVSDDEVQPNERVTFSANASGGEGDYSYSWEIEGTDNEKDQQSTAISFRNSGTYNGTVTIEDDAGSKIQRTCSVAVEDDEDDDDDGDDGGGGGDKLDPRDDDDDGEVAGDRDTNFAVQCMPEDTIYSIGEKVTFDATIDSDDIDEDDIDDFDWSGNDRLEEDGESATVQYTTSGIKEIQVDAEYDGETESDKCYVQIRGNVKGVSLDKVPYTGPADTAKTIAFILTLLLLGLGGGYISLKYYSDDEIPVGIPTKN